MCGKRAWRASVAALPTSSIEVFAGCGRENAVWESRLALRSGSGARSGGQGAPLIDRGSHGFVRIRLVSTNKKVELVETIGGVGGRAVAVDRRPKLNERLAHRVVAWQPSESPTTDRSTMTEI